MYGDEARPLARLSDSPRFGASRRATGGHPVWTPRALARAYHSRRRWRGHSPSAGRQADCRAPG